MSWDDPAMTGGVAPVRRAASTPARPEGDELGRGGQGTVLLGRDRHLPRDVAWKVASAEHPEAEAMLAHEASVLAALEHPGIVPVYDLVKDLDGLRMAIRVVRGRTLEARIAAAPPAERLRLVRHVLHAAEAVAWAHQQGYVHRDLKPSNIMIGELGETQVIDWGIAVRDGDAQGLGRVVGTPQAMSPEQARGERVGPPSDVWGLGAILFHLVAGRPLYPEPDGERVLAEVRRGRRPRLLDVAPSAPRELCAIVDKALAPDPEDRYPDARGLAADVLAWLDGRRVAAHRYGTWELALRFARRFWLPLAVLFVAVVAIVILGVGDYFRVRDERDRAQLAEAAATRAVAERERAIATSSIAEARRELQAEQRAEARAAATRGLGLGEDPWARGVLAALGRSPEPRLVRRGPARGCLDAQVAPDGRLLCGTRDAITVWDGDRLVWSRPLASRGVAWLAGGAMVVRQRLDFGYERLDASSGASFGEAPAMCRTEHQIGAGSVAVAEVRGRCLGVLEADATSTVTPCPEDAQSASVDRQGRWVALCRGGDLVFGARGEVTRTVHTELATWLAQYAVVAFDDGRLFFGTTIGEVLAVDADSGRVLTRRVISPGMRVRALSYDAGSQRLVARIEGAGPDVLDAVSLASYGRLARQEQGLATWLASGRLATWNGALALWDVPSGGVDALQGLIGVTGFDAARTSLVVTYESAVSLVDVDTGRALAHRAWQDVVAKAPLMAPDGGIDVGLAIGETNPLPGPARDDALFRFVRGTRRLVRTRDDRLVKATTGRTLTWGDGAPIDADGVVIDLAGQGDRLGVLLDGPFRGFAVYTVGVDAERLAECAVDSAVAIAMGPSTIVPEVYLAEADGVVVRDATCAMVRVYATPEPGLTRVQVSASGRWIAGGTRTGEVLVWSADGDLRARVQAHAMAVSALVFDPSERWLASGSWDGRVRFYATDAL